MKAIHQISARCGLIAAALACGCADAERPRPSPERWYALVVDAPAPGTGSDAGASDDAAALVPAGRPILANDLINARDLGGTAVGDGAVVAPDVLYRGPPLARLSGAGCLELAELGVRTIIDLRISLERESEPEASCALEQARSVLAPLPVPYDVSPAAYIVDLNAIESIAAAFGALGDDTAYPIYMHCTLGRDRTGVLAALILSSLGAAREDIMQEYSLSQATVGAYPDSLAAMLDELERQGGIDAYLASAGVSPEQLATLRAHAVAPSLSDSDQ